MRESARWAKPPFYQLRACNRAAALADMQAGPGKAPPHYTHKVRRTEAGRARDGLLSGFPLPAGLGSRARGVVGQPASPAGTQEAQSLGLGEAAGPSAAALPGVPSAGAHQSGGGCRGRAQGQRSPVGPPKAVLRVCVRARGVLRG